MTVDTSGNIYCTGSTQSTSAIATSGAYQTSYAGGNFIYGDAYIVKFNSKSKRIWATYYGGSNNDIGLGISADKSGNVFISGGTFSSSGMATKGSYQTLYGGATGSTGSTLGGGDAFLTKFDQNGKIKWATYYGGSG